MRCFDCGKQISKKATRCKSCSNRNRKGKYKYNGINRIKENNPAWKGKNIGYFGLHKWLRENKPKPEFCEKCGQKKRLTITNLNGNYNRDFKNFGWFCYSCHNKFDKRCQKLCG